VRNLLISVAAMAVMAAGVAASSAATKEVPYPAVKVQLPDAYKPDAAFAKMQRSLADAAGKKDVQALLALVGPTFVWLSEGDISDQFDFGGDALQNFKVVFGFRNYRKQADGGVSDGPYWDALANFAADRIFEQSTDTLVCGPMVATVDDDVLDNARQKIGADDSVEWYFTTANASVTATPAGGATVGHADQLALPVLDVYPQAAQGQPEPPVTHLKVLLPSGKSGWIPVSAALPLVTDRLCYALMPNGDWKIAGFDQAQ